MCRASLVSSVPSIARCSAASRPLVAGCRVAVPLVKERMQSETANVVLPAEPESLTTHLAERQAEGVRMNLNFLGEALLGEMKRACGCTNMWRRCTCRRWR